MRRLPVNRTRWAVTIVITILMVPELLPAATTATTLENFKAGSGLHAVEKWTELIKTLASVLALVFAAWIVIAEFRAWGAEQSDAGNLVMTIIRAGIMTLMIGFVITLIK
ncbi:MAG: hypothetical protein CSB44_01980 [Gammaproteobacteria bacterium]|nr:MAG: hypothetical protein CSB44_01980 [Gammaproteobacteria bacterium]